MERVNNVDKGSFTTIGEVKIFDADGKPFYQFESSKQFVFNLPAGVFYVEKGNIKRIPFKQRKFIKLPKRERFLKVPKTIKIIKRNNPMKAVIYKKEGLIYLDPKIFELPRFCFDFIKYHELGHYYYSTERFCDLFAAAKMLHKGYNPSQIYAAIEYLNEGSETTPEMKERIDYIFKHTTNGNF